MAYRSKQVIDRLPLGPNFAGEFSVAVTIPAGSLYTDVSNGGATNNCGYLALLRGENGDGLGAPVKSNAGTPATAVVAYFNQTNIAAPSPLLGQFSEFGNWTAQTNLLDPLIKTTSLSAVNSYAAFDKNGVCLGINSTAATAAALPGFAKLVTIWAQPVMINNAASAGTAASPTASTAALTVAANFIRNANATVAGSNILRYYPYSAVVNANDRVGTAGKS